MGKEGYLCSAVEGHQHIDVRRKLLVRIAGHGHGGVRHKNLRILRSFEQTGLECPGYRRSRGGSCILHVPGGLGEDPGVSG